MVRDASGDPLANVTVSCMDLSGDTRGATLSQADGTFSLTIARKGPAMVTAPVRVQSAVAGASRPSVSTWRQRTESRKSRPWLPGRTAGR